MKRSQIKDKLNFISTFELTNLKELRKQLATYGYTLNKPMKKKERSKCGEVKNLNNFYNNKNNKDGKSFWCTKCNNDYHKEWHLVFLSKNI